MPTPRTDSGAGEIPEVRRSTLKSVECTAKPEVFSDYWTPLSLREQGQTISTSH